MRVCAIMLCQILFLALAAANVTEWGKASARDEDYNLLVEGFQRGQVSLAKEAPAGKFYNPYFENGVWISMPPNGNLTDGAVKFDDGAPNKIDDMAKDVSAFLAWTAEPKMEERKQTGFEVLIYLLILAGLMYALKRKVWSDIH